MNIPEEAVEAAARVMKPRQFEPDYTPLGMWSDLEQMHEIAELDRDMTRDRVRDILTAAYPSIEKQIRAEVAAEIRVEMRRHDTAQIGFSAIGDAYAHAARIAEGARLMDMRMKPCAKCGHGKSLHLTHGCHKTWTKRGQTFAGIGTYTEWCRCDGYQEKEQA